MLLGAAALLAKHQARLKGSIKFLFQPAEEGSGQEGLLGRDQLLDCMLRSPS